MVKQSIHSGHRQRMREKLMNNASKQMLEHELLEILLFYAQPRKNTNETAHLLLREYGTIKNIFNADAKSLTTIEGVSDNIAAFLKLFPEMFDMYNAILQAPLTNVSTTRRLKNYIAPFMENAYSEVLYIVYIDEKFDAYACEPLKKGNAVSIGFSMDELLLSIQKKAPKFVALAHNHPYGLCYPSQEDVISTIKIKYILKIMGIEMYDHIIFGKNGYCAIMDIVNEEYDKMISDMEIHNRNYENVHMFTVHKD